MKREIAVFILAALIIINTLAVIYEIGETKTRIDSLQKTVTEYIASNDERMRELEQRVEIIEEAIAVENNS